MFVWARHEKVSLDWLRCWAEILERFLQRLLTDADWRPTILTVTILVEEALRNVMIALQALLKRQSRQARQFMAIHARLSLWSKILLLTTRRCSLSRSTEPVSEALFARKIIENTFLDSAAEKLSKSKLHKRQKLFIELAGLLRATSEKAIFQLKLEGKCNSSKQARLSIPVWVDSRVGCFNSFEISFDRNSSVFSNQVFFNIRWHFMHWIQWCNESCK